MTKRVVNLYALFFATASAFFAASAHAQANTFRLYAGLVPTRYKLTFDGNANITVGPYTYANRNATASYVALNLGGTWVSSMGIYVDLSAQKSLSAKHGMWSDIPGGDKQDFSHDTYTLTGGYAYGLAKGVTVSGFGGGIFGRTELSVPSSAGFGFTKDEFDSRGFFIGAGAGIPALGGQVSGSGAIAFMRGKWTDDSGSYDNKADATRGLSLGGAYTYRLTETLGLTADVRFQQYSYDFKSQLAVNPYTVKERIVSLGARLSYHF